MRSATVDAVSTGVISVAVMAHPRRLAQARALAAAFPQWPGTVAVDPFPEGPPTTLRAARAAWAAMPPDATHHLVLQDDVRPCRDFTARLASAVSAHPDSPLALYANWNSWNGAATRAAALAGASWAVAVTGEWVPALALLLPRADVQALLAAVPEDSAELTPDDVVLERELAARGRRVLISVPHLVEHVGDESLIGNDSYGPRHSACFADDLAPGRGPGPGPEATATGPAPYRADPLVHVLRGRGHAVLAHPDGPRRLSSRGYLRETGLLADAAAGWEHARRAPGLPGESRWLTEELWYAAYLMGVHAAPSVPAGSQQAVRACLRSLVLGGSNSLGREYRWALEQVGPLTELAASAVEAGRTRRRRHGPPAAIGRDRLAALPPASEIWQGVPTELEES